jgi:hypothetical protein
MTLPLLAETVRRDVCSRIGAPGHKTTTRGNSRGCPPRPAASTSRCSSTAPRRQSLTAPSGARHPADQVAQTEPAPAKARQDCCSQQLDDPCPGRLVQAALRTRWSKPHCKLADFWFVDNPATSSALPLLIAADLEQKLGRRSEAPLTSSPVRGSGSLRLFQSVARVGCRSLDQGCLLFDASDRAPRANRAVEDCRQCPGVWSEGWSRATLE